MTDISKFAQSKGGMFMRAEDVQKNPGTVFKISGEGTLVISEKFNNERLQIPGMFGKDEKIFDCSKTNARIIQETLGGNTVAWIGAELTFETYKTRTTDGKMVDAINVKLVKKA